MTGNIIMFTGLLQPTDVLVAVDAAKSCVAFLYLIIILLLAFANKSTQALNYIHAISCSHAISF